MNLPHLFRNRHVSRNLNELHEEQSTVGDRLADALARFGGSWTFIVVFAGVLALWMGVNSLQLLVAPFDPYPFIFLNLVLSCLAAIQAPVILMSQNRQAARDRLAAELDYACNLKAELEVERLHEKLDMLREQQLSDVIEFQRQQLELLCQALGRPGPLPGRRWSDALQTSRQEAARDGDGVNQQATRHLAERGAEATQQPRRPARRPRVVRASACHHQGTDPGLPA